MAEITLKLEVLMDISENKNDSIKKMTVFWSKVDLGNENNEVQTSNCKVLSIADSEDDVFMRLLKETKEKMPM
jgi:hypothetical protein